jgi:hypothetical protein
MSEDPLGLGGGDVNLYRYAANKPIRFKVLSGLYGYAGPNPNPRSLIGHRQSTRSARRFSTVERLF